MGSTAAPDAPRPAPRQPRGLFPPEVVDFLVPPLKVGAWSALPGVATGVGYAIARDINPFASGAMTGGRWFAFGTSYWFFRTAAVRAWGGDERMRPAERVAASTVAATATGALSGLMGGPTRILPAMAFASVFGAGGQLAVNAVKSAWQSADDEPLYLKWSPLRRLTDEQYLDIIGEKILKLEVEIALIDDKIAELRAAEQAETTRTQAQDGKLGK
ncbi:hypothetical protein CDD83_9387 [Cordyceps sp. RAO-2017]|nr:hypothetical protein CDD83_9387 [Cordyceps sp. RAO-2017]